MAAMADRPGGWWSRGRRRGVLALTAASLIAPAAPGDASPRVPPVLFRASTTEAAVAVTASDADGSDASAGRGLQSQPRAQSEVDAGGSRSEATSTHRHRVHHGPLDGDYTVRRVRAVSNARATATADTATGTGAGARAVSTFVTRLRVQMPVQYALSSSREAQTDDTALDCSLATVTLRKGDEVLYRKTSRTAAPGCSQGLPDVGVGAGELSQGDYTLESRVVAETRARGAWTVRSRGRLEVTLDLGSGKRCRNVLPPAAGATLVGTAGRDVLCGGAGPDIIKGRGGDDVLIGYGGADRIFGHAGRDAVDPGGGRDTVYGGRGNDHVYACDSARDDLFGGPGWDAATVDSRDRTSQFEKTTSGACYPIAER